MLRDISTSADPVIRAFSWYLAIRRDHSLAVCCVPLVILSYTGRRALTTPTRAELCGPESHRPQAGGTGPLIPPLLTAAGAAIANCRRDFSSRHICGLRLAPCWQFRRCGKRLGFSLVAADVSDDAVATLPRESFPAAVSGEPTRAVIDAHAPDYCARRSGLIRPFPKTRSSRLTRR